MLWVYAAPPFPACPSSASVRPSPSERRSVSMVVIMDTHATSEQTEAVATLLRTVGLTVHPSTGRSRTVIGVIGDTASVDIRDVGGLPGVQEVIRVSEPYKLASRKFKEEDTV